MNIGKIELTQEKSIIIITGAVIVIALAVYFIFYAPLIRNLMTDRLKCMSKEFELLECCNIIESAGKTAGERVLISEEDASLAIRALTEHGELAKHNKLKGIDFISISPKEIKEVKDAQYKILPVEMEIESTYEEIAVFLGALDDLEKALVKVKSFDITPDKEDPSKLTTDLAVEIYLSGGKNE